MGQTSEYNGPSMADTAGPPSKSRGSTLNRAPASLPITQFEYPEVTRQRAIKNEHIGEDANFAAASANEDLQYDEEERDVGMRTEMMKRRRRKRKEHIPN